MSSAAVAELLGGRRVGRGRWVARCPAHADRSPSLSIAEGRDGRILLHCWAGCNTDAVLQAAGLSLSDLFGGAPPTPEQTRQAALVRAQQEAEAHQRRIAHGASCDHVVRLEAVASELAGRLMLLPAGEGGEMLALFERVMGAIHSAEVAEEALRP